ncbi:hypothetical protein BGZ68_002441 [Mortierella alpina]|nr:hypothetical protein BGZ68_002441 [Mortierella alpina]
MSLPIRTIFEYPEMCHTIAGFLGYHDYSVLARVNKAFYRAFFPYLMRSVVIANTFKYFIHVDGFYSVFTSRQKLPPPNILFKYGQHVHHLNLHFKEAIDFCYYVKENSSSNTYRLSTLATFPGQIQTNLYLSLLEKCPNLGCLQITVTHSDWLPNDSGIEDAVILEQAYKKAEIVDDAIARMIRTTTLPLAAEQSSQLPTEEKGSVLHAEDRENILKSGNGLRKFFIYSSNRFAEQSIQALIQRHSQSLRVLEVRNCARVGSTEMWQLLRLLPKLREVEFFFEDKIRYRHGLKDPVDGVGRLGQATVDDHEEDDVSKQQHSGEDISGGGHGRPRLEPQGSPCMFSCADSLTYLRVPVMSVTVWERFEHPSAKDTYGWFFDAIGTLTRLQELHIQSIEPREVEETLIPFQLTIESGLWHWKGLGEMEVFSFEMVKHHNVGPREIEWMKKHWPRLRELAGLDTDRQHPKSIECELLMRAAVPEIKVPGLNSRTRLHLSERHYRSLETQR